MSNANSSAEIDDGVASNKEAPASSGALLNQSSRRTLPRWLDHFNCNDLKIVFRCWVAVWVVTILMFVDPYLQNVGMSAFFGAIVLYIAPPAGILTVYLFASLSLLLGMCLAWAWGLLSMKAAFAVRSDADTQLLLQSLQRQAASIANQTSQSPAAVAQVLVYDGYTLDARVVAIFFVMSCVFIYALARLRYANAKLILLQIFGTIVTDIFILSGPILTGFNAKLAQVLVKPGAIGIGLGVACSVLIFPQSSSYVVLSQMEQLIRLLEKPLASTKRFLAHDPTLSDGDLLACKTSIITSFRAMEPGLAFLPIDLSRGRWSADDVKSLQSKVRDATAASLFLLDFHIDRVTYVSRLERQGTATSGTQRSLHGEKQDGQSSGAASDSTLDYTGLIEALKSPEQTSVRVGLLNTLKDTTADALQAGSKALQLAAETVNLVNTSRWYLRRANKDRLGHLKAELVEIRTHLQATRDSCIARTNDGIIRAHAELFNHNGQLNHKNITNPVALNGLILSIVLEERILGTAAVIEGIVDHVIRLLESRTEQRVWLPCRIQYAVAWLSNNDVPVSVSRSSPGTAVDPVELQDQATETHTRLRMVRKGTLDLKSRQRKRKGMLTRALVGTYEWLFNPGGMYALRMVVVTIALAIPAVLPSTAGFFYRQKGIWAVIMAQTCILMHMADFTFSLVCRGAGTVVGGALALAVWYSGSGSGHGNAYGLGATTAVASLVLVWFRIYLPAALTQAVVIAAATFVLIIGFSWDQYHVVQYGLPGLGYTAFWKRLVTVLIGFAAASIVQIFPRPPSATRFVCQTLANQVRTLTDHYALLISQWGHPRPGEQSPASAAAAEQITLKVAETLFGLTGSIRLLRVEMSTLPFDEKILSLVQQKCSVMNRCLGKLLVMSSTLSGQMQDRLTQTVGLVDNSSVANFMSVLSIVESSLRTGSSLPERMPVPLVESCFLTWYVHHERAELSVDLIRSEEYRQYCVAVSCYMTLLSAVDDLVEGLKSTLGETHVIHHWDSEV